MNNGTTSPAAKLSDRQILYLLLYLASDEGRKPLPERWQFLTSEVVGGLFEYLTGQEFRPTYSYFLLPHGMEDWGSYANREVEKVLDRHGDKISRELALVLKSMLHFEWSHDHGESWGDNPIRFMMLFGRGPVMSSTFYLTVPDAEEVRNTIIPALSERVLGECRQIAELMKKYVQKDLEFMDEHRMT